ncbi:aromatic ring-hydroxylating dioxygenase subunit alpha [Pseudomonas monteilii]|uniref:aromatic ring-hydroxylating dioxygenase subunit alpha n=1 Tax=Pseudomonas monteilii TaxID=76759 RepID=UPI001E3215FA|nr:aromatic ring-hydroxylating dioxygenase subunit alpha [Pseudomonas monteilii]MCE1020698.1 aromatic ring-hydroxylating dioxygenase subunit alpha [Pseudomonas monteilii]MCE1038227.1 aromatic ring-hydroxylating dioxygenase subunit alpha [Pseudomonas monteilii]MCE1089792.1 aromatic ring-hydroxylating dioxygenase subunit alpha [Pseudomonas monteilii]
MAYLRNTWYVAAWDEEIKAGELFSRQLLSEQVVFYREQSGRVRALVDRCPHRFAPLSKGTLCGDVVRCPYHGLEFGGEGQCTRNPHGNGVIPKAAKVRAYPVVEKYSVIWIWMGDEDKADEALIPDFSCMDPEHFYVAKRYLHARANYVLESDNILDLSHIQYLHPGSLGSDGVSTAITRVEQQGDTVWSYRQTVAEILPDFLYQAWSIPADTRVDRWIDVRWDAPSNMLLLAGAVPTGVARTEGRETALPHLFTPETETTTHYWFSFPMPLAMGDMARQIAEDQVSGLAKPFTEEDLPMLEAQQLAMGGKEFWEMNPILLPSDAGAIRARRVLDTLIATEQTSAS